MDNEARVSGVVVRECVYIRDNYFMFKIVSKRESGTKDIIPIIVRYEMIKDIDIELGDYLAVYGEIKTYNEKCLDGVHLRIYIEADEIIFCNPVIADINEMGFEGYICKSPILRETPKKRKICDMVLAVNNGYEYSSYIPCIAWGNNAELSSKYNIGDKLQVFGRFQSREYKKDNETRTAYEISVENLKVI